METKESQINLDHFIQVMLAEFDRVVQCNIEAPIEPLSSNPGLCLIHRLPTEVIIEIFRAALSPWSDIYSLKLQRVTEVSRLWFNPLNLGKICKSWREIAWSTSWVWDTVYLNLCRHRYDVQVSLLEVWLSRAGSRPLSICVTADERDEHWWQDQDLSSLMRCVVAHSDHWQSINLFLPRDSLAFLAEVHHSLPLLESLSIRPAINDGMSFWETSVSMFSDAPLLDDVEISSYFVGDLSLPWEQLKCFSGRFCTVSECIFVLRCAPHLRSCWFIAIVDDAPIFDLYTATKLETLKIVNSRSTNIRPILQHVILPALLILEISSSALPQTYFGHLRTFFHHSACLLQRLSLDRIVLLEGAFISCLETIPTLSELEIVTSKSHIGNALSDRFICSLHPSRWQTVTKATNILLPRLQIFKYTGYISFTLAALQELLSSRWHIDRSSNPEIVKLTHVSIRGIKETQVTTETTSSLHALVAEGLELMIRRYDGMPCF